MYCVCPVVSPTTCLKLSLLTPEGLESPPVYSSDDPEFVAIYHFLCSLQTLNRFYGKQWSCVSRGNIWEKPRFTITLCTGCGCQGEHTRVDALPDPGIDTRSAPLTDKQAHMIIIPPSLKVKCNKGSWGPNFASKREIIKLRIIPHLDFYVSEDYTISQRWLSC